MNSPKSTWDSALDDSYHFQLRVAQNSGTGVGSCPSSRKS
jgi:hypothetical protein